MIFNDKKKEVNGKRIVPFFFAEACNILPIGSTPAPVLILHNTYQVTEVLPVNN